MSQVYNMMVYNRGNWGIWILKQDSVNITRHKTLVNHILIWEFPNFQPYLN